MKHKRFSFPNSYSPSKNIEEINIIDADTNILYISDLLETQHPSFYNHFTQILKDENIQVRTIPDTKSIWVRDFMPVQVKPRKFVKFNYAPDYLLKYKKYRNLVTTRAGIIAADLGYKNQISKLIIDGGNIVKSKSKMILTTKIFNDNSETPRNKIISEIEKSLDREVILIPWDKSDIFGHTDGLVRFINENTVLVNEHLPESYKITYNNFIASLISARLNIENMIVGKTDSNSYIDATGLYLNFLEIGNIIFVPIFNLYTDDKAIKRFEKFFPHKKVIPVVSNEIAKDGGVLNCISWNVLNNHYGK